MTDIRADRIRDANDNLVAVIEHLRAANVSPRLWHGLHKAAHALSYAVKAVEMPTPENMPDWLHEAYDEGVTFAIKQLAELTGSKDWQMKDGSEDHNTDVRDTIMDVLKCAGLHDDETGKFASMQTADAKAEPLRDRDALARIIWLHDTGYEASAAQLHGSVTGAGCFKLADAILTLAPPAVDDLDPVIATLRMLEDDLRSVAVAFGAGDELGAVLTGYADAAHTALCRGADGGFFNRRPPAVDRDLTVVTDDMLNAAQSRLCELSNNTYFNDHHQTEMFIAMVAAAPIQR
jgi:hypothetical protein